MAPLRPQMAAGNQQDCFGYAQKGKADREEAEDREPEVAPRPPTCRDGLADKLCDPGIGCLMHSRMGNLRHEQRTSHHGVARRRDRGRVSPQLRAPNQAATPASNQRDREAQVSEQAGYDHAKRIAAPRMCSLMSEHGGQLELSESL